MSKNISRKNISNKLMIFESDRKKWQSSASWQKKVMSEKIKGYNIGEEGVGSRYSFAM